MPQVQQGQTAYGIVKSLGITPEQFLAIPGNEKFKASGHANDYQGLSGLIQPGMTYNTSAGAPQTPAPAPTTPAPTSPTPANPVTTPVDTTRYARTANSNDQAISELESQLSGAYSNTAPDLAKITEEKRKASEALVDSIRAEYARILGDQVVTNTGLNNRVRALNTTAGLGGSDFASANAINQEKKNQKALDLINKERDAKIQAVYADIDQRASAEYQRQREEYVQGLKDNIAAKKQARDEDRNRALNSIKGFAEAGIDVTKLKETDPNTFNLLLKEYGGSQLDLETAWNAALPENMKVQYTQKTIRGENGNAIILRYGFNPVTGKTESKEYDLGVEYGKIAGGGTPELKEIDGRLWSVTVDSKTGKQVATPLTDVSELVRSQIAKNYSDVNNGSSGFKFTNAQRTKLISANFDDAKISAVESDLKKYGLSAVLDGFSTEEEKTAVQNALKGSDFAAQLAEYMKNGE